jgi:hypothetical protein
VKIALIHDWLTGMRGGERALLAFCEIFPDADLYTLVRVPGATDITCRFFRSPSSNSIWTATISCSAPATAPRSLSLCPAGPDISVIA